jgi:prepilin-type N-terminal cleavage/methylation domain-containing protein
VRPLPPPPPPRAGLTLPELLAAVTIGAILVAAATRAVASIADGAATHAAGAELRSAFATARALAVLRATRAAVRLDSAAGTAAVHLGSDTVRRLALRTRYGVHLATTRDSMAYAALGIGYGAANLRVVLTRGHAADTVTVSRLGRVR